MRSKLEHLGGDQLHLGTLAARLEQPHRRIRVSMAIDPLTGIDRFKQLTLDPSRQTPH